MYYNQYLVHFNEMAYKEEVEAIIQGLFEEVYRYDWKTDNTLSLVVPFFEEIDISIENIEDIMIGDLNTAISIFISDPLEIKIIDDNQTIYDLFIPVLKNKHIGIYSYDELLFELLISNTFLNQEIIMKLTEPFDQELIQIVHALMANNLNLSNTAKKLFVHRNTLNYKLEKTLNETFINLKTFKGCMTAFLLIRLIKKH